MFHLGNVVVTESYISVSGCQVGFVKGMMGAAPATWMTPAAPLTATYAFAATLLTVQHRVTSDPYSIVVLPSTPGMS